MSSSFVITVAQQKGGAGKTTVTAHLAVMLARMGHNVGVIDIDPQGSLTQWHAIRKERLGEDNLDDNIVFSSANGWRISSEINRMRLLCDIILIDSPPHVETEARAAIRQADLVLVPLQPSPTDLWATKDTYALAREEKVKVHTILNRVNTQSKIFKHIRDEFSAMPVNIIGNRVILVSSIMEGLSVSETAPHSLAALEIEALADTVMGYMVQAKAEQQQQKQQAPERMLETL